MRELGNGFGTYNFDYIVMADRRGSEDWQAVRLLEEVQTAAATNEATQTEAEEALSTGGER